MHANKQRDGTYSIVPQMQGGLTTPAELKSLAETFFGANHPKIFNRCFSAIARTTTHTHLELMWHKV
jgi:hypothetical protein